MREKCNIEKDICQTTNRTVNKGSLTVETACVMSLILFTLLGLIYLNFFVHNRAWLLFFLFFLVYFLCFGNRLFASIFLDGFDKRISVFLDLEFADTADETECLEGGWLHLRQFVKTLIR